MVVSAFERVQRELADLGVRSLHDEVFKRKFEKTAQECRDRLEKFIHAKNRRRRLKHPHFDFVRGDMAPYVEDGFSMQDAYYAACRIRGLNPYEDGPVKGRGQ